MKNITEILEAIKPKVSYDGDPRVSEIVISIADKIWEKQEPRIRATLIELIDSCPSSVLSLERAKLNDWKTNAKK